MARTQRASARTQRLIAGGATALVATASALALGRVFQGTAPTLRLLAAGVASAAIAAALERRALVLATLVSAAGLLLTIGWLVLPATTWAGLPTLETLRAVLDAAALVGEQARVEVAPSPPLAPLMLAGIAGVWAAVFASHSLAFRAGSPLLALLPPVALVGFADSVLEDVVRPIFGLLFLLAASAVLFADGLRRVHGWGPVWAAPGRAARLDIAAGRGARRVAASAMMVAAVAPVVLPGFGSRGVIDFSTSDDRVRIDPLVSVQESLQRDDISPVFEVQADVGRYWRMVALPNFDGRIWSPDPAPATIPIVAGTRLETTHPATETTETTEVTFTTTSELALPWLPLPYPSQATDASFEGMRWDPEGGSVSLDDSVAAGETYTAVAEVVQPTPEDLRAQTILSDERTMPFSSLPADLDPAIVAVAREWTRGAATDYDRIIAIQERFAGPDSEFAYDADVPASTSDQAMLDFLTVTKVGFCQQFSSTMAVMLRALGIPARLAVGFTPGHSATSADRLSVTTENAHSWVEVLFPSYGWVPFEPTPNRQNLEAYPYLDPTAAETCNDADGGCGPRGTRGPGTSGNNLSNPAMATAAEREAVRPDPDGRRVRGSGPPDGVRTATPDGRVVTFRSIVVWGLAAGGVALAAVPPLRAWRRRRRLRRAGSAPRGLVLATYDVFADRAAELGHRRAPGQTLEEYRRSITTSEPGRRDLDVLTALATDAAYGGHDMADDDVRTAARASDSVMRALRRDAGWAQRLAGPYRRR